MPSKKKDSKIIPLEPDYDESTIQYVKHKLTVAVNNAADREEIEQRVPVLPLIATPYQKLMFFEAFDRARRTLRWTTGPRLYQKFEAQLATAHLRKWNTIIAGENQTVANFDAAIVRFKRTLLGSYKYSNQMDYLRERVKKPTNLSPAEFRVLFESAEQMALQLPDAPANGGFEDERRPVG